MSRGLRSRCCFTTQLAVLGASLSLMVLLRSAPVSAASVEGLGASENDFITECSDDKLENVWSSCSRPHELSVRAYAGDLTWVDSQLVNRTSINRIGWLGSRRHALVLVFPASRVTERALVHARLRLSAVSERELDEPMTIKVRGLALDEEPSVSVLRAREEGPWVDWKIEKQWPGVSPKELGRCVPLRRYSPDLTPIIESLRDQGKKYWVLILEPTGSVSTKDDIQFVSVEDQSTSKRCWIPEPAVLELFPTLRSTMIGKELLGRISDRSVILNVHLLKPLELQLRYARASEGFGERDLRTPVQRFEAGSEGDLRLNGLAPDTRYIYQLLYRSPGAGKWMRGPTHSFHTQRMAGTSFEFVVQSDPHLQQLLRRFPRSMNAYRRTLASMHRHRPDFLIDLGDTFQTQWFGGRDAKDQDEAIHRHLDHRRFFDIVGHSMPLFLVMGNHEGEQGWRRNGTPDSIPVWATRARKLLYPNPIADDFFSAPAVKQPWVGYRESIFAWTWGDALFVALDPFWFTAKNPHPRGVQDDPWRWTLGREQYEWLAKVLEASDARFKFVFAHHMTGGFRYPRAYGRGGVRAVQHRLGHQGSYEWGGEGISGTNEFATKRPGWPKPVHQLLVDNQVTVFFRGHDHCYAREQLDGIVYQTVPMASDPSYGRGACDARHFNPSHVRNNSGYLRVLVDGDGVRVDYQRLDSDRREEPLEVLSYQIVDCDDDGVVESVSRVPPAASTTPRSRTTAGVRPPAHNLLATARPVEELCRRRAGVD